MLSKYTFNYPVQSAVAEWRGSIAGRVIARTRIGVADQLNRSPYAVWDASAAWSKGRVRPFLQFTNLTSTVYQEIPNVALPKRGVDGWNGVCVPGQLTTETVYRFPASFRVCSLLTSAVRNFASFSGCCNAL